jgi:hypothetical protein
MSSRLLAAVFPVLFAAAVTGCHWGSPGSSSFASVTITNRTPEEIRQTTKAMFLADGYNVGVKPSADMVFEREGSFMSQLAYGGWISTEAGNQTWVRVRANLVDLGGGLTRLQCNAFMVQHYGDSFFEEENRLAPIRSGPFQDLLNKVAKELN